MALPKDLAYGRCSAVGPRNVFLYHSDPACGSGRVKGRIEPSDAQARPESLRAFSVYMNSRHALLHVRKGLIVAARVSRVLHIDLQCAYLLCEHGRSGTATHNSRQNGT